jgi:hypothetical protein
MGDVRRRLVSLGIAVAVAAALVVAVGAAEVGSQPGLGDARPRVPDGIRPLTLPTGDRLAVGPGDSLDAIGYDRAGSSGFRALHRFRRHGQRYAVPAAAVPKVATGQMPVEAFNVDRLLGGPAIGTANAVETDPTSYHLTVTIVDRGGATENSYASFSNLDTGEAGWFAVSGETLELPAGRYAVLSEAGLDGIAASLFGIAELRVTADASVVVDHRGTRPVKLNLDNPQATRGAYNVGFGQVGPDDSLIDSAYVTGYYPETRIYAGAAAAVGSSPGFRFYTRATIEQKAVDLQIVAPERFGARAIWLHGSPRLTLTASLPVAYAGRGSETEVAAAGVGGKLALIDRPSSAGPELTSIVAAVARAGGRFVAVRLVADDPPAPTGDDGPALNGIAAAASGADDATLALPTALMESVPATDRLVALAQAGPVRAALATVPASPFQYQLGYVNRGGAVPTTRTVHTAELAEVPVAYRGARPAELFGDVSFLPDTPDALGGGLGYTHLSPDRRTEYYTPGPWRLSVTGPRPGPVAWDNLTTTVHLTQGVNAPISWGGAVVGPSVHGSTTQAGASRPWARRQGNIIDVLLPLYADAAGHPRLAGFVRGAYFGQPGVIRLYRGETLIGELPQAGIGTFEVPAAVDTYRLFAEATAADANWPLSTRVSAEWTFRSGPSPVPVALALLAVRYAPVLDLTNAAPAGRSMTIPVTAERQDGAPPATITALTVEVSTDDGATWRPPVALVTVGGAGRLTVMNPGSGYVSLRAKATDSAGNSVTQTIIRAYRVR